MKNALVLETFWLTTNESIVYQSWLQVGTRPVSAIARQAWLHRVVTYDTLKQLCKKWLCTCITKGKTWRYTMQAPETLKTILQEKMQHFDTILPQLQAMMHMQWGGFSVQLFQWFTWLQRLYDLIAHSSTQLKAFLGAEHIDPTFRDYLYDTYLPVRIKNWIHVKGICSHTSHDKTFANKDIVPQTEVIMIDHTLFNLACEIVLFDNNKISLWALASHEMSGVLIESEGLFKSLESIHNLIRHTHTNHTQTYSD